MEKVLKKDLPKPLQKQYSALAEADRKPFLEMYSYITHMAASLEVSVSEEDLLKFLKLGKFTTKQEVNKFLFDKVDQLKKEKPTPIQSGDLVPFDEKLVKEFNEKAFLNTRKQQIERDLTNFNSQMDSWQRSMTSTALKIAALKKESSSLTNDTSVVVKIFNDFNKIAASPDFENVYFDPDTMMFHAVTKQNAMLKESDAYPTEFNFGKFDIVFGFSSGHLKVVPFKDNLSSTDNFCHPHVYKPGHVCYGTATAAIAECMKTYDMLNIYNIVNLIIHNYNNQSPIRSISNFGNRKYYYDKHNYEYEMWWHKDNENIFPKPSTTVAPKTAINF